MVASRSKKSEWLAVILPVAALVCTLVIFGWLLARFWTDVGSWARRDLRAQAELAAENLSEPLRTQDFRKLTEFHRSLEAKEMILRVRSAQGGWIFHGGYKGATVEEYVPCGDYQVGVAIRESRVYAPFYEALGGFILAALVGVLGMFAIFFVLYRQRIKIRELAKLEKFRREFIADVSHEIKTPLTGILGAVDMINEELRVKNEEWRTVSTLFGLIKKEAKRLNGLVQSILDLARLERDGDVLNVTKFDLDEMLRELAAKYGIRYDGAGGRTNMVLGDAPLILQAVSNLVENAKRHSGTEDIGLSLTWFGGWVQVIVEDHGIGIPPEHAARIFERFHRVDQARAAETGGAGLGLAIVRRIARLHGGDVTLVSAKPHGCRFELSLPR